MNIYCHQTLHTIIKLSYIINTYNVLTYISWIVDYQLRTFYPRISIIKQRFIVEQLTILLTVCVINRCNKRIYIT